MAIVDATDKYIKMIEAFECDFNIALEDEYALLTLNKLISEKNERIIEDVELLKELSFLLRHGKAFIICED